jgi:hypothetical protein
MLKTATHRQFIAPAPNCLPFSTLIAAPAAAAQRTISHALPSPAPAAAAGMSDLTALHAQSKRLILLLREGLERLEVTEVRCRPGGPLRPPLGPHSHTVCISRRLQHGPQAGDTNRIAADLQGKLGELRVGAGCTAAPSELGRPPRRPRSAAPPPLPLAARSRQPASSAARRLPPQRISHEMDGVWRMQVVRENSSRRDVWKR